MKWKLQEWVHVILLLSLYMVFELYFNISLLNIAGAHKLDPDRIQQLCDTGKNLSAFGCLLLVASTIPLSGYRYQSFGGWVVIILLCAAAFGVGRYIQVGIIDGVTYLSSEDYKFRAYKSAQSAITKDSQYKDTNVRAANIWRLLHLTENVSGLAPRTPEFTNYVLGERGDGKIAWQLQQYLIDPIWINEKPQSELLDRYKTDVVRVKQSDEFKYFMRLPAFINGTYGNTQKSNEADGKRRNTQREIEIGDVNSCHAFYKAAFENKQLDEWLKKYDLPLNEYFLGAKFCDDYDASLQRSLVSINSMLPDSNVRFQTEYMPMFMEYAVRKSLLIVPSEELFKNDDSSMQLSIELSKVFFTGDKLNKILDKQAELHVSSAGIKTLADQSKKMSLTPEYLKLGWDRDVAEKDKKLAIKLIIGPVLAYSISSVLMFVTFIKVTAHLLSGLVSIIPARVVGDESTIKNYYFFKYNLYLIFALLALRAVFYIDIPSEYVWLDDRNLPFLARAVAHFCLWAQESIFNPLGDHLKNILLLFY